MQMATSNRMYPIVTSRRMIDDDRDLNTAAAQYTPTRLRTMCPALMLAASRKDRVAGRTMILVVSISTRNGFSQSGAPSGRKCATDAFGLFVNVDNIILSHRGNPKLSVKIRCLDVLNMYGIIPNRLIRIISENSADTTDLMPLRLNINVRLSWAMITDVME
jgi:hypothetical protein